MTILVVPPSTLRFSTAKTSANTTADGQIIEFKQLQQLLPSNSVATDKGYN